MFRKKEFFCQFDFFILYIHLLLRGRLYFPYTKVLDIHISGPIPSEGCYRTSPRHYLIRLATTFSARVAPSSRISTFIYLYPWFLIISFLSSHISIFTTVLPFWTVFHIIPLNPTHLSSIEPIAVLGLVKT